MSIKSHHTAEFLKIFNKHISKNSKVYTDKHKSFMPLQKEYNITRDIKYKKNSPANSQIQQLKSWLRHVHKHVSHYHADTYFNEYSFRINRSQSKDSIVHKCIERMVKAEKLSWKQITQKNKCMKREDFIRRIKLYRSMGATYKITGGRIQLVA
jgi:transposase-like protein